MLDIMLNIVLLALIIHSVYVFTQSKDDVVFRVVEGIFIVFLVFFEIFVNYQRVEYVRYFANKCIDNNITVTDTEELKLYNQIKKEREYKQIDLKYKGQQ